MSDQQWLRWLTRRFREAARDNQWLLPALGALLGWLLALVIGAEVPEDTSWTVDVDRSRDTLAGALGLVFTSLSIVLALASVAAQNVVSRFGSRVMRVYVRRSPSRIVIAAFACTATFILTQQFLLRELDPDSPAPVGGLMVSIIFLVITGSLVIWYIAAVIRWFRVDKAVEGVVRVTLRSGRQVARRRGSSPVVAMPDRPADAIDVPSPRHGHLAEVDADQILSHCRRSDSLAVITCPVGAPVVAGEPIGWVVSRGGEAELRPGARVLDAVDVSDAREVGQSIEYGLFGLVDIAIIALSPAVNDPNSAAEVIQEMSFLFQDLAEVPLGPYALPDAESWPRVVVRVRTFGELVELATTQIVLYGIGDPVVVKALRRFADSLRRLDLDESDVAYVEAFDAKLEDAVSL